jgi:hypothetical protein
MFSGMTAVNEMPLLARTNDNPMPVLPEVASTTLLARLKDRVPPDR